MQIIMKKDEFREALLSWYHREKRDLPWRHTSNPYYIWVSEIMLQQTRVDTVIPYYERFIDSFPTMEILASANENDLLKMWEGLGYYSRARNLQMGVREVVENYGGEVPDTRQEISKLKGVGPYTAGAVLSIAFGVPEHAVDGNVMRVMSRLLLIEEDIAIPRTKKIFETVVMELIDRKDPSSFNQGLMELGATICTPKPKCLLCPVRDFCNAFHEGRQEELPVKTKKTTMKVIPVASFAIQNKQGEWLLRQRPAKGLLAGLWEFPMVERLDGIAPLEKMRQQFGVELENVVDVLTFKHIFSHITWEMTSFKAQMKGTDSLPPGYRFFTVEEVEALPKPVPVLKIWEEIKWEE
ncbi:A/G-specific adenine glycosylase [Sporosarcina beigongshangi]|uniref:A/G-specific adenine glycosylase n=1 Tax=Sporosarcina beigongshangi TaxID=2782538 RepID=UPI0019393FD4|nr:A/G-specific adenine glycosylase [Sporosarcina beigongshangi]